MLKHKYFTKIAFIFDHNRFHGVKNYLTQSDVMHSYPLVIRFVKK